jgi:hypothetical protein
MPHATPLLSGLAPFRAHARDMTNLLISREERRVLLVFRIGGGAGPLRRWLLPLTMKPTLLYEALNVTTAH